ncbi:Uncharacterised protein [Vibrio cholerae]|nr:Uncharacterised protein [Vibrio cholerae]
MTLVAKKIHCHFVFAVTTPLFIKGFNHTFTISVLGREDQWVTVALSEQMFRRLCDFLFR